MTEHPLLAPLTETDRRAVLTSARRRRFARHEIIFHEGDPGDTLHLIAKGRVAIRVTTPRGDIATLTVLGPGESFGELALVATDHTRTATAAALEPAETLSLTRPGVEQLIDTNPGVARVLIAALADTVQRLSTQVQDAYFLSAERRVLRVLTQLADQYATGDDDVVIPLDQGTLGTLAGTTRKTVNKVLNNAQDDGQLTIGRGRIEIHDLDTIARHAR